MFNAGIIGSFIATFFSGLSITLQKKESMHYGDRGLALVYQYAFVVFWSVIFIGIYLYQSGADFMPQLSLAQWLLFVTMCIVAFVGGNLVFVAYRNLHGGVAYIIGSVGIFVMYFANMYLFPGVETLSPLKVALAVLFFLVLVQFIIKRDSGDLKDTHFINKYSLYAIGASLCGAYFVTGNNYLLKTGTISPMHTLLFSETIILCLALVWYFVGGKGTMKALKTTITRRDAAVFATIGICGAVAGSLHYYAYVSNPANIINFVKLFSLITTSTLCWIFLKDTLSKRQVVLLICAVVVLIAFLMVK